MVATVDVDFGPETQARIADLRQLCERAEDAIKRLDAFEKACNDNPKLVVTADCSVEQLLEMLALVRAGKTTIVEAPITDGGTL